MAQQTSVSMEELVAADMRAAAEAMENIAAFCRSSREQFVDPSFPPAPRSLGAPSQLLSRLQSTDRRGVQWLRPAHVRPHGTGGGTGLLASLGLASVRRGQRLTLFGPGNPDPRPTDVVQGTLGTCYLLSALCVLAEQPALVRALFPTTQPVTAEGAAPGCAELGAYQVRLYKDGQLRTVVVDDTLPCWSDGRLAFAHSRTDSKLWPSLVEKAAAKLFGSYAAIESGEVHEALALLTGAPTRAVSLQPRSRNAEDQVDADLLWAELVSSREAGYLLGAGIGAADEALYERIGLLPVHAYSIVDVRSVGQLQLVQLRNPWGRTQWRGDFSSRSPRWTPELRAELGEDSQHEGVFWMSFVDLLRYFHTISICKVRSDWSQARLLGQLGRNPADSTVGFVLRPQARTQLEVSLFQSGLRGQSGGDMTVDLGAVLLRIDNQPQLRDPASLALWLASSPQATPLNVVGHVPREASVHVNSEVMLDRADNEGARYLLVPTSISQLHQDVRERREFVCLLMSHQPLLVEPVEMPYAAVGRAMALATIANSGGPNGKRTQLHEHIVLHKHNMQFVVENLHRSRSMNLTIEMENTENVVSSRGSLTVSTCVPPRHCQLVMALAPFAANHRYSYSYRIHYHASRSAPSGRNPLAMFGALLGGAPAVAGGAAQYQHSPPLRDFDMHAPYPVD